MTYEQDSMAHQEDVNYIIYKLNKGIKQRSWVVGNKVGGGYGRKSPFSLWEKH